MDNRDGNQNVLQGSLLGSLQGGLQGSLQGGLQDIFRGLFKDGNDEILFFIVAFIFLFQREKKAEQWTARMMTSLLFLFLPFSCYSLKSLISA